eukprot:TRINITY_DN30507_c0_g1_i1.p1 TRINITY_DN30507_c0_g1~~TRINITY_DN30507_c0_g1_i1.p1  ORF type:complete len:130 (+),score=22.42 TRINITY_DN30507_c0_g1_i1:65-454(+)
MTKFTPNALPIPISLDHRKEFRTQAKAELQKRRARNAYVENDAEQRHQIHQMKESLRGCFGDFLNEQHEEWLTNEEVTFKNKVRSDRHQNRSVHHYTASPIRTWGQPQSASVRRPPYIPQTKLVQHGSL